MSATAYQPSTELVTHSSNLSNRTDSTIPQTVALGAMDEHASRAVASQVNIVLPAELWIEVVTFVQRDPHLKNGWIIPTEDTKIASETLKALSLTCRELRQLSQPLLFETFAVGPYGGSLAAGLSYMERLLLWIRDRPEITKWVRQLVITHPDSFRESAETKQLEELVCHFFVQLPNIRRLAFTAICMLSAILSHIPRLKSLQSLEVRCNYALLGVSELETEVHRSKFKQVVLRTLSSQEQITAGHTDGITCLAPLILSSTIETLDCDFSILEHAPTLPLYDPSLFQGLTRLQIVILLQEINKLANTLRTCPNMLQFILHVSGSWGLARPASNFPKGCLDRLEEYDGPSFIIKSLGIGRPLRKVTLRLKGDGIISSFVPLEEADLSGLASSTVGVQELRLIHVKWSRQLFDELRSHLGSLQRLELRCIGPTDCVTILLEITSLGAGFPELRHLSIEAPGDLLRGYLILARELETGFLDPNREPGFVERVSKCLQSSTTLFPELRSVRLYGRTWSRDLSSNAWSDEGRLQAQASSKPARAWASSNR